MRRWGVVLLWVAALALPWAGLPYSLVGSINLGATYALIGVSMVLLTGWVGQISLGHAALVGVGAYATGWASGAVGIDFPFNLPIAAGAAAALASLLGVVALRVRGLYLAVATLVFGWMASEFLFRQSWLLTHGQIGEQRVGSKGMWPSFSFTDRRVFASVAWAVVLLIVLLLGNLRAAKSGRAFVTVRSSEFAAASLGINVVRTKLMAFSLSGAVAGLAGNLSLSQARVVTADDFTFTRSLFFLAIAVVGGLDSLGGAVVSALLFAGLTELFFQVEFLGAMLEIVSALLLVTTLLAYPEGLAGLGAKLTARLPRRSRSGEPQPVAASGSPLRRRTLQDASEHPITLRAESITVRFGGLVAVSDATLDVRTNEITGLIGPNGAGKTTLFNAIAGFVTPAAGRVLLRGVDLTSKSVHERAAAGMARTFQHPQLLGRLTVMENLLVASHSIDPTAMWQHLLWTPRAIVEDRAARDRAREVITDLALEDVAQARVADLPFGILRRVELARALVTGFPLILLDEPASGLDEKETHAFGDTLLELRAAGMTLLLIEHDVNMVMRLCDRITVLDQGRVIASGPADEVRNDPAVLAAYLGHRAEGKQAPSRKKPREKVARPGARAR